MKEIRLTRGKVAIIDDEDFELVSQYKWCALDNHGFGFYAVSRTKDQVAVYMHRLIMGEPVGVLIDHKNRNSLDNTRKNLRLATVSQNGGNRKAHGQGSIYKGVVYIPKSETYQVRIACQKKRIFLGYFENELDAAKAYDRSAKRLFGEFAKLNFPEEEVTQ